MTLNISRTVLSASEKKTNLSFFITNNNGTFINHLLISQSDKLVYSIQTGINTKINFSEKNKTLYNRATINLSASIDNTKVVLNDQKDFKKELSLEKTSKSVDYSVENEMNPIFSINTEVLENQKLRLSISIDNIDSIYLARFDEKFSYSGVHKSIRAYYDQTLMTEFEILFSDEIPLNLKSYEGENQGAALENGISFERGTKKYLLIEVISITDKEIIVLEASLIKNKFTGHDNVTKINCSTTKPIIYEVTDSKYLLDTLYVYSPIESKVNVQISVNIPSYSLDSKNVDSVTINTGAITPIELDSSFLLQKIEKLYISVFSTEKDHTSEDVQLFFGNKNVEFLPINTTDANFELAYSLSANQHKTVIIQSKENFTSETSFSLSTRGGATLSYKKHETIKNCYDSELTKDATADSTFASVGYEKGFIVVLLKGTTTETSGKLFITKYNKKVADEEINYSGLDSLFFSLEPEAEKTVTLTFKVAAHQDDFKLFITSRNGSGSFKFDLKFRLEHIMKLF